MGATVRLSQLSAFPTRVSRSFTLLYVFTSGMVARLERTDERKADRRAWASSSEKEEEEAEEPEDWAPVLDDASAVWPRVDALLWAWLVKGGLVGVGRRAGFDEPGFDAPGARG